MNELRFDHGQGSWPYLIPVEIRTTRTLSKPDGICSSVVGQPTATALAPPLGRETPYS